MGFLLLVLNPTPTITNPPHHLSIHNNKSSSSYRTIHTHTQTQTHTHSQYSSLQFHSSPPAAAGELNHTPHGRDPRHDFYVNLGLAVRTLRHDLPLLFSNDLNYHIYRDDITFLDPLNKFTGIHNYKLIFWALRFHGRILFKHISLEVFRVWQPSENLILIRWNLRGIPRVPWEANGHFQGTSRYKVDRHGKIYEHKVDNLAFNFPLKRTPAPVLDLVPATPNPTFSSSSSSSWVDFYHAVKNTLDHAQPSSLLQDCLPVTTCL